MSNSPDTRDVTRDGWTLFFDGLCEPVNPGGTIAWGWTLHRPGEPMITGSGATAAAPTNTNNIAEYMALGYALCDVCRLIQQGEPCHNLLICGDSKLVVCQVNGTWKSNTQHLTKLRDRCIQILDQCNVHWLCEWIPRDCNEQADALSREAYKALTGKEPQERRKGAA